LIVAYLLFISLIYLILVILCIGVEVDEHENQQRVVAHHSVQSVTVLFPSALCSAVIDIITLLNDPAVTPDGNSVCETAYQV